MLDIKCPNCERQLQLPEDAVERECRCPGCGTVFEPADRLSYRPWSASSSTQGGDDNKIQTGIESADDANVLAERGRRLRPLETKNADRLATYLRWSNCTSAAKIGFAVGLLMALVALVLDGDFDRRSNVGRQFLLTFGIAMLGGMHGLIIVLLAHVMGPKLQSGIRTGLVSILALWILIGMYVQRGMHPKGPTILETLVLTGGSVLVFFVLALLLFSGLTMLGRLFIK